MKGTTPKDEKTVTLGAVNWKGEWGNVAANLEKMKKKAREAAAMGIDMLCFPEMALSGYECGEEAGLEQRPCALHSRAAETIPGPATKTMADLAKELDLYIIFGMPEKDGREPNLHYISAAVVGPEGILGSYRKINLAASPPWTEDYCFKAGHKLALFETRYGPIGVQICADFWAYPEQTRLLAFKGARIIFNPTASASAPGKIEMMRSTTASLAQAAQSFVVSCNHSGKERTISYYGHSTIAGPGLPRFYNVLAEGECEDEIIRATVSFEGLEYTRRTLRIKERGRWGLIAKEYRNLEPGPVKHD